jgi:hypothetical protein
MGQLSRDGWRRRGVKTFKKVASPGHNTCLNNGSQDEGKVRGGIKK